MEVRIDNAQQVRFGDVPINGTFSCGRRCYIKLRLSDVGYTHANAVEIGKGAGVVTFFDDDSIVTPIRTKFCVTDRGAKGEK